MKDKLLLTTLATTALATASASAGVIVGPTDFDVAFNANAVDAANLTAGDLNGEDDLIITYAITRGNTTTGGNWLTATLNTADTNKFLFTTEGVFAALVRTNIDNNGGHTPFNATGGNWSPNNTGAAFNAGTPASHAVRITIGGLSSGGFTGVHAITFEVDHYASTFVSADKTFSGGTIDFGATDVGLNVDLRSFGDGGFDPDHTVTGFTVFQVPEPGSLALLGLGGLCLIKRRRRD